MRIGNPGTLDFRSVVAENGKEVVTFCLTRAQGSPASACLRAGPRRSVGI